MGVKRYVPLHEFWTACDLVIQAASQAKPGSLLKYAGAYASAGKRMNGPEEIRVQSLYILSNLQGWRGEKAKYAKAIFKHFSEKS